MTSVPANSSVARCFADYVVGASPTDLPEAIRHEGLRSFINWVGCALGGSHHQCVEAVERALIEFSGPPQATILGRGKKADILLASLLNCTSSGAYSFDDTHAEMILHPGGPIAAALLALSERTRVAGADFLLAFVLGLEIECRLGRAIAVTPARCDIGWYLTGLTGGIGAAAAVGKLLGLDRRQLVWAMGIAASGASGIRAMHTGMCSAFIPAHAGQTGLRAALLAEQGFTAPELYVEGLNGFLQLYSFESNLAALTENLGQRYEVSLNTYKPYPCGIVVHPAINACLELKAANDVNCQEIDRIELRVHPAATALAYRRNPQDSLEAAVSIYHCAAAAIVSGTFGVKEISTETVRCPAVIAVRDKIEAVGDSSIAPDAAEVTVSLRTGDTLRHRVEHCVGSSTRPMSDRDLEEKFRSLANGVIETSKINALLEKCWGLTGLSDVGTIARTATG